MQQEDLYGTLGIGQNASSGDIRAAFRHLAAALHPDLHPGYEELFKEVSRAYAVLADPAMRERYDRSLRGAGPRVGAPYSPVYPGQDRAPTREWWANRQVWESQACPDCDGTGRLSGVRETCLFCRGWGAVALQGRVVEWRACALCGGLGYSDTSWCARCWGLGTAKAARIETYRTPPRIRYR